MTMFRFPSMKQVFSELFPKKAKKENRQSRHLALDALESRELLTVTAGSSMSYFVNELPIYETNSNLIEQIQNLKDNNFSIDYDMGGDEDGDLVVTWERPDVVYTTIDGETEQYQPLIDNTTLSPTLDWNIYARYLTNETQRVFLDTTTYDPTKLLPGEYNTIGFFYGEMQDLDPNKTVTDKTVDTKIASGLVYKISFSSEAQPLTSTQESIEARFSIYAQDESGKSQVATFTFTEEYEKTLSIDGDGVLDYTQSIERNAQRLQASLRGLGQTQGKYLNDCVVKAVSPTEFYVYVYSDEVSATWNGTQWVYAGVPNLSIYQENPEAGESAGFEVSANVEITSSPVLYTNIIVDPANPLQTANNIQKKFDSKLSTNLMAPIAMPAPDRINAQRLVMEGPATETDLIVSGGIYPQVLVVPVYGLTDEAGRSLDGYVYDITFIGDSSYINHPLLAGLNSEGTKDGIQIETIKESSSEFRVNDPEPDNEYTGEVERYDQLNPSVAMDADGDFVITWQSEVSNTLMRGSYVDIYAKTYSARSYINDFSYLATPTVWPEDMMTNTIDTYTYIEVDGGNNYYKKTPTTVYVQSVCCTSDQFRVNTSTTNAQRNPDVAMDLDGNFVIVWDSEGQTISYFNGIYMQRYTKDAKAIGKETRVDGEVTGASTNPTVAADDNGQFAVAWEYTNNPLVDIQFPYYTFYNTYFSYYYETDFYYESEIHASVFNVIYPTEGDITNVVPEFAVGNTGEMGGKDPSVTWSDCGDYIIGWSALTGDTDSTGDNSTGVYAIQYKLAEEENVDENGVRTVNIVNNTTREQFRVNSATLEGTPTTYWDYSQLIGEVGLDADGDVIITYSGYGPDVSVNSIIPYIQGASLSTTNSWMLFLDNMQKLLIAESSVLNEKYPSETYANLLNFFNPTGRTTGNNIGDSFNTVRLTVEEDGTLVTFTSQRMIELLEQLRIQGVELNVDIDGQYRCHGDVDSVIAMVITNAQMLFRLDPQYAAVDQDTQNVILGSLTSILESQFGLLRGDSSGVMYTQIDAATGDGMAASTVLHSDSVANDKRDGVTAVSDISLDVSGNRIWDQIVVTIANLGLDGRTVDVTAVPVYNDLGNGLFELNEAETAEAIEAAISAATNIVGTSWRDQTDGELELFEGPVEVRAVTWDELQKRGLMHIGDEDSRYSNASMDFNLYLTWFNENADDIFEELGIANFADFTFEDLLQFVNAEEAEDPGLRQERIDDLPVIFEIVYQGSVHDLEVTLAWRNSTVRLAEQQLLTLNPNQAGILFYALQVNGQPNAFTDPVQLLTFDCTNEATVMASLNELRAYLENQGFESVEVELVSSPDNWGPGEYEIRINFPGQVGQNITMRYITAFPLPPLTEQGGYDPAQFPWLANGRFQTLQDGGTYRRVIFGTSMYYFGDMGTPQTDSRINVTPEGDFQMSWLQHELFNSRILSANGASSSFNSYSNTNICVRPFDESTDTAGPKMSGINLDGKRIQQAGQVSADDISHVIVYFNEEMMYYDKNAGFSNSQAADWDSSVINPDNWLLLRDGVVVTNGITDIVYGMNMSQYLYDADGNPLSEYGSNKWEAIVYFDSELINGTYELIARSKIEDVKGNSLNKNGDNPEGADATFSFNVVAFEDPERVNDDIAFVEGEQYFEREVINGQSMLVWSPQSTGMDGNGDTITVWISETEQNGVIYQEICYRIDYVGSDTNGTGNLTLNSDYYRLYSAPMVVEATQEDMLACASVAMGENGDFILTWSEYSDSTGWDVYARRFNLDGTAKDSYTQAEADANHKLFIVNSTVDGDQMYSTAAISATGDYAITWQSKLSREEDKYADWDIYAAQFYADGASKVDEPETQELIFSDKIYSGSFKIQYAFDQTKSDEVRETAAITVDGVSGTISYGNVVIGTNTPANMGKAISMALKEIGIVATVESTNYTLYTVEVKTLDGEPVSGDFEELAILPVEKLKALDGTAIYTSVNTKYNADSGEILVNQSYLLEAGAVERQTISFGTGNNFVNIQNFKLSFTYTDANGYTHYCATKDPIEFNVDIQTINDANAVRNLSDEFVTNILEALDNIFDQDGEKIEIANEAFPLDADAMNVDQINNRITITFAGDLTGFDISDISVTNVKRIDKTIGLEIAVTEDVKGTMGGIVSDADKRTIALNSNNYVDLQSNDQMFPSIAMDALGNFVVTWTSFGDVNFNENATEANIYARRFDSNGNTVVVGLVNTNVQTVDENGVVTVTQDNVTGTQKWSSVAMSRNGEYVITWTSDRDNNADVYAKRYTFLQAYYSGEAAASALDPNAAEAGSYYTEAYSYSKDGFLCDYKGVPIFFHSNNAAANPTIENYAALQYKALSEAFMVNTTAVGYQQYSKVSMDAEGNFIITWESDDFSANQSEKIYKTYAQRFNANSSVTAADTINKFGNELLFGETNTRDSDRFPSVAMNSNGDWVLAWTRVYDESSPYYANTNKSDIYQVKNLENPTDDEVSPVITKFQAASPLQQGDLFTYLMDSAGNIVRAANGNPIFTWKDTDQRYSVNADNEINTVDASGVITSLMPLNNVDNPTYVYNPNTDILDIYTQGDKTSKAVTVTNDLPFGDDFTQNGLLNYVYSLDENGKKEYSYTDLKEDAPFYLDTDSGKIYNPSVKLADIEYLIKEDYPVDDNVVAIIVGFSEEMSTTGSTSVLNPSNWKIYQNDIEGNKVPIAVQDIVLREDSMFSEGENGKHEIVIYLEPGEDGLPCLPSGYSYEFIGSENMEDLNENKLDGTYSQWRLDGKNGLVGGTESGDFDKTFEIGKPTDLGSGNVSEDPDEFDAADLEGDTLVNSYNQQGIQENSAVATDMYGNYIVVWETDWIDEDNSEDYQKDPDLTRYLYKDGQLIATSSDQTNAFRRIMAQLYDYDGKAIGSEFVVCLEEYTHQSSPDVAMDDYGNIVITWVELTDTTENHVKDSLAGDTEDMTLDPYKDGTNIVAVRYNVKYDDDKYITSMTQVGDVFEVDNDVRGAKSSPKVAIDSTTGNFVIVWSNDDSSTSATILRGDNYYPNGTIDKCGIYARIFNFSSTYVEPTATSAASGLGASASDAAKPFLVNIADDMVQQSPAVAMENGNLMIVWQSAATSVSTICGRSFVLDNSGNITQAFAQQTISQSSTYRKSSPDVSMDSLGNAVVVYAATLQDGSDMGIYARTFKVNSQGEQTMNSALSQAEFRVNTTTFDTQLDPSVAVGDDGRCVISWTSFGQERSDYDITTLSRNSYGVFAKWYNDIFTNGYLGTTKADVQINSLIYGSQFQQDVAMNRVGQSVFSWTGPGDLLRNYVSAENADGGDNAGGDNAGGEGGGGGVTNTHDNLLNGAGMAGVSNHVSVLDYSDIYRRRFLWTPAQNVPSTLSPDFTIGEGTTGTYTPSKTGGVSTYEVGSSSSKTVLTSVADGSWTLVENSAEPKAIESKGLVVDGKGSAITLYGSSNADTVKYFTTQRNGKTVDAVSFTNALGQNLTLYNFSSVNILGRGGSDTVVFDNNLSGSDARTFTASGNSATLTTRTKAYTYTVTDFANIAFNAVNGDTVNITDTLGTDKITVTDKAVTATGAGYAVSANGFSALNLKSTLGSDTLSFDVGTATQIQVEGSEGSLLSTNYQCNFSGFAVVNASAKTSGSSSAGRPSAVINVTSADAVVNMYSSRVSYTQGGSVYTISNFGDASVSVASEAADCVVNIYDSVGVDYYNFNAAIKTAQMNLANGYKLISVGCNNVSAFSSYGGTDTAEFNDSADADIVTTGPRMMTMTDSTASYKATASGFAINNAISKDNLDTVKMSDANSLAGADVKDDFYISYSDLGVIASMQSTAKTTYNNTATGFANIEITSTSTAAIDTARITDGEGDYKALLFTVSPDKVEMVSNKANVIVNGFRNKIVSSDSADITLYDSIYDDTLIMQQGMASMSGKNADGAVYSLSVTADDMTAESKNGGVDTVTIICSSDLVESISSYQTGEKITVSVADTNGAYRNQAKNFKSTFVTKADAKDSAYVEVKNSSTGIINAYSYLNSFTYNQEGSKGKNLSISGTVKSLEMMVKNATPLQYDVNVQLHDSALADELDANTSLHEAVITQVESGYARKFTNADMTTVSSEDSTNNTKLVDGVLTDWDDWTATEDWLKGDE